MKIWQKLVAGPAVAVCCLFLIALATHQATNSQSATLTQMEAERLRLADLMGLQFESAEIHAGVYRLFVWLQNMDEAKQKATIDTLRKKVAASSARLDSLGKTSASAAEAYADAVKAFLRYDKQIEQAIDMASVDPNIGMTAMQNADQTFISVITQIAAIVAGETRQMAARSAAAESAQKFTTRTGSALSLGALVAVVLVTIFMTRSITRPLREATAVAQSMAAGDFTGEIRATGNDEVSAVINSFAQVRRQVETITARQVRMVAEHAAGNTDYRIADAEFPGAYGDLARKMNDLVSDHLSLQETFVDIVREYADGRFGRDMPRLPGKKAEMTAGADRVKCALMAISGEIDSLVEAASRGEFAARGDPGKYAAKFAAMVESLNRLMDMCQSGLADANRMFAALADGDLTPRIDTDYAGSYAELRANANRTMDQLAELIGRTRKAAESINTAGREIASGNDSLSNRTEEQAATLEETASSMQGLTATVRQNAANARRADEFVLGASESAKRGGATVKQVVATMTEIAASSERIQDIIAVIDGIAFQTNILALNAAVEAARAGEQGRGFAVVASEVRNLAQRSAGAAREIKGLIVESVTKVRAGSQLVSDAGIQMDEIMNSVRRVTDIMAEISAASAEQTSGIEQVSQAVGNMDQMTQQNAALAEEAAAAAHSLRQQAEELVDAVGVFKVAAVQDRFDAPMSLSHRVHPHARRH